MENFRVTLILMQTFHRVKSINWCLLIIYSIVFLTNSLSLSFQSAFTPQVSDTLFALFFFLHDFIRFYNFVTISRTAM